MNDHSINVALTACVNGYPGISEDILRSYPNQNDPRIIFNLGWHEMRHGNLKKGLAMLDAGRLINVFGSPAIPGVLWKDENLTGKTVLFRSEGGFGDQIINFRFAKDFKEKGANVIVSCSEVVAKLFARHGHICIDERAIPYAYYDYWVPGMSAAHMLGYDTHNFPSQPYLTATPRVLHAKLNTLRVGIRWAGNPHFEHEQHRKFDPAPLIALHQLEGVTFYSLQRDNDLVDNLPFADLRNHLNNFDDTASIIQGLDLVITSCTSVAHLSAALGKETWVIVPVLPYYTWAVPGIKSIWYDTVTLFRQEKYGDWEAPISKIKTALEEKTKLKMAA